MMDDLAQELSEILVSSSCQLSRVYELTRAQDVSNRELVGMGIVANQGVAANHRTTIRAIFEGSFPKGPTLAAHSRRSIGGLLRDNPGMSSGARNHLEQVRSQLEEIATSGPEIELEDISLEKTSRNLAERLSKLPGVYVYTLPSFYRTVLKTDPDRYWFKVGRSERGAGIRIGEQGRSTGLPEDPWIARVYRSEKISLENLESIFHRLLAAAGHAKSNGRFIGREWYATNLEFLDAIASAIGCEIDADEPAAGSFD